MVTDKQIQANQTNALSSTGPQTPEGKEVSKMNALKHGLLSKQVLLENENESELLEFGRRIREDIRPIGEMELLLTDKIITYAWRLRRVISVEKALMDLEHASALEPSSFAFLDHTTNKEKDNRIAMRNMIANDNMETLNRYEASMVRHFYKALHELQRLQAARRGEKPALPVAVDVEIGKEQ